MSADATCQSAIARLASDRLFVAATALVFAGAASATIVWCMRTPNMDMGMGAMPMPSGALSLLSPICGRGSLRDSVESLSSFLGMWIVMMVAMMMPSLMPALWRYRQLIRSSWHIDSRPRSEARLASLTALACAGYLAVWTAAGAIVFLFGAMLDNIAQHQPMLGQPFEAGALVLIAGVVQFSAWKARRLACCHIAPAGVPEHSAMALRHGLRLGVDCVLCCGNLMTIPLAMGLMDLPAMTLVTIAITLERLAPATAQAIGGVIVASGLVLVAQAAGLV